MELKELFNWQSIILVPVIMILATGGTIGLIKLIKRFSKKSDDSSRK